MQDKDLDINKRIGKLIEVLGVSKNKFGRDIGISSAMVSKITTSNVNFGIEIILKIVYTYKNVRLDWLLKGEGEMFRSGGQEIPMPSQRVSYIPFDDITKFVRIVQKDNDLYDSFMHFADLSETIEILKEMVEDLYLKYHQTLVVKLQMTDNSQSKKKDLKAFYIENEKLIEDIKKIGAGFNELNESFNKVSDEYFVFAPTPDDEDGEYLLK